ncbi:MAG: hypothetical protein ACTIJ6_05450 [Leucobacter sp.]
MAKIEIGNAFVEEQVGTPVFVLKIAEPHSKKDEQGKYQTISRTFFDVKVSRDSGIDLGFFPKGSRVQVWGNQKTEVREHEGKRYYTLTIWADRIQAAAQQGQGGSNNAQAGQWAQPAANGPQNGFNDDGFSDQNPF